ncbi:MAG: TadE/TadG family type IV pilus assembly protein [Paracoccaceae bacterium]
MKLLQRFWASERGAIGFVAIFAAIPLLVALFMIVNSAKSLNDRTRNQDAADMIAIVHAAEAARSLNTISMNQVSMTQVFATGVTSGSLIPLIRAQMAMALVSAGTLTAWQTDMCHGRYKYLKKIPKIGTVLYAAAMVACEAPLAAVLAELGSSSFRTHKILGDYDVVEALENSNSAINALNKKNIEIYDRFPEAVSVLAEQIAEDHKVRNIYFDDSCANPGNPGPVQATSCDDSDKRQGMNLPVVKNLRLDGYARFCAGLHTGTSGLGLSGVSLSGIPGLGALGGGSLINGSYFQRGFPMNKGPMLSGGSSGTPHLRDFVNDETGMGERLEEYYDLMTADSMFDGLLNPHGTIARLGEASAELAAIADEELDEITNQIEEFNENLPLFDAQTPEESNGVNWPTEQTADDNYYKDLVDLRTLNMCAGDAIGALLGGVNFPIPQSYSGSLDPIDVYHPAAENQGGFGVSLPSVQPNYDDYSDHFKVLAFSFREPNSLWAPGIFRKPNNDSAEGFFTYSQAIVFNQDEIGLYSQNWKALLMPADKMERIPDEVIQRIPQKAPSDFGPVQDRVQPVYTQSGWDRIVVR